MDIERTTTSLLEGLFDTDNEIDQLQALLLKLAADRRAGDEVGAAGRAYFEAHHAPTAYAQNIVAWAEETASQAGRDLALRLSSERHKARNLHPDLQKRLEVLTTTAR